MGVYQIININQHRSEYIFLRIFVLNVESRVPTIAFFSHIFDRLHQILIILYIFV